MPELTFTRLAGSKETSRLLIVGPSLGTSVETLWTPTVAVLDANIEVIGWDLPGHGRSIATRTPFTVADIAAEVRRTAEQLAGQRPVAYAGVSFGGAVGFELALEPGAFTRVSCIAASARISEPQAWRDRADFVRQAGTPAMVASAAERWFARGFLERAPTLANRMLLALAETDDESYALACLALADFDVRDRLSAVKVPLLIAPGEYDVVVPPMQARETAEAAAATFHVIEGCGHLSPVEDPLAVASLLRLEDVLCD